MILGENQQFASPGEALIHFGVKGMRWGVRKEKDPSFGEPYSSENGNGHGSKKFELKDQTQLRASNTQGFIDVRPKSGFSSPRVQKNHDELVSSLQALSKEYPNLANLKVEVVPMSKTPEMKKFYDHGSAAALAPGKSGEIRLGYHDKMSKLPRERRLMRLQPGLAHEGFLGNHEMGHALAVAGGVFPPGFSAENGSIRQKVKYVRERDRLHREVLQKHGFTFHELSKISNYAATRPEEALAEVAGYYFTPSVRSHLTPEQQRKAKSLFDDLGGKQ
jgi:hypothetical protein